MSQINLIQTNLISKGYKIYEAKIESNTYYVFQQSEDYDIRFKSKDLRVNSKYLRSLSTKSTEGSKYQFYEHFGRLLLADLKKLTEKDIFKILEQLLVAIYNLHCQNTMGRCFDIENVIITMNNDIMLMDFGFGSPLKYKPIEFITQIYQNGIPYDIKFDLFLIGKIAYYLVIGHDIPVAEDFIVQWESIQKQIKQSVYSIKLQDIIIKLLQPDPQLRLDCIQLSKLLQSQLQKQIEDFYTYQLVNLNKQIIENINERDQEMHSRILLKPPPLKPIPTKPQNQIDLIYKLQPLDKDINKIINFNLYKFTLIKQAKKQLEQLYSLQKANNIAIILSNFALQKMNCVAFYEFRDMLKAKRWEYISNKEVEEFHNSGVYQELLYLVDNYIYSEQESMATYLKETINDLNKYFPDYKTKQLYQEVASLLTENCQGLSFNKIKHEYRLPLNNLITVIEQIENDLIFVRFRLLILMNILINKIMNFELIEKHFNTIQRTQKISVINSPHQIDLFLRNATIEQLNLQYQELQAFHFTQN